MDVDYSIDDRVHPVASEGLKRVSLFLMVSRTATKAFTTWIGNILQS